MFDRLDAVNDYKEQVIDLIDALIKAIRIKKILISTRNHLREELEDNFRTFAFDLNNFNDFIYLLFHNVHVKRLTH